MEYYRNILQRFFIPLAIVIGIMIVSSLIYHGSTGLSPGFLRTVIKDISGFIMFVSIWFFGFVGPPIAYFRGATFFERSIVAFVNPVIWLIRMALSVSCQFTAIEMVYFFFLPWTFGIVCVTFFELSVSELICRYIDFRRGNTSVKIFHPAVIVFFIIGITGIYFGLIRGQEWSYMVVHHYSEHFLK
ncbi:MAG: hypothetical protein N3F66_15085 [Spirochaetes bacterium]|nr:hypothetical protein [Spirochaetota bacterium]